MIVLAKIKPQTWLEAEQSVGFRSGPSGELELMSPAETEAAIMRAIREALCRSGWPRLRR